MGITDFLVWLAGGGSIIAASWLLGQFAAYKALADNVKQLIFFGLAVVFGGGAFAVSQYVPAASLDAIAPYFLIVSFVFVAVFINKAYAKLSEMSKALKGK